VPAHVVSPGVAVLATWAPEGLADWVASHDFARFTAHTVTDAPVFADTVQLAQQRGYSWVQQQVDLGLAGLAVALTDRKGRCVGALSMTFQASAYPDDSGLTRLLPPLQEAAQALRAIL
jgi:IclR family pca regulon transcriptional regulator